MRVCVFGSSSTKTDAKYLDAAFELGQLIGKSPKFVCVNGGGNAGVMGALNKGCRSVGGEIVGVIHEKFCVDLSEDRLITNMVICRGNDLEERKKLLIENGDCIVVMPGGVGTFDEFWDVVSSKSLGFKGLTDKPIVVVNIDGFYDGFVQQLCRASQEGLLYGTVQSYFHVCDNPKDALAWCASNCSKLSEGSEIDSAVAPRMKRRETFTSFGNNFSSNFVAVFVAGFAAGLTFAFLCTKRSL